MSFPQTALATAADAILATLPPNAGKNPIGTDPRCPWPRSDAVEVVDDEHSGTRWVPYYEAYPVLDASGLFEWTSGPTEGEGQGSTQIVGGLTQDEVLAANVTIRGGDKSWSADYTPPNLVESQKPLALEPHSTPPKHWTPVAKAAPVSETPTVPIPKAAPPETPIPETPPTMVAPTLAGEPLPEHHVAVHVTFFTRLSELPADVWAKIKGWL